MQLCAKAGVSRFFFRSLLSPLLVAGALAAGLLAAPRASATITIGTVQGASNYVITAQTSTASANNTIYGGVAGNPAGGACASPSTYTTCNNCVAPAAAGSYPDAANTRFVPCNQKRITNSQYLGIQVTSSTTGGYPVLYSALASGTTAQIGPAGAQVAQNASGWVYVPWSTICAAASANSYIDSAGNTSPNGGGTAAADCESMVTAAGTAAAATITVKVGIAQSTTGQSSGDDYSGNFTITVANVGNFPSVAGSPGSGATYGTCSGTAGTANSGLCGYYLRPGDQKGIVKEVIGATNFPLEFAPVSFASVRFFYVAGPDLTYNNANFFNISPATTTYADVAVPSDGVSKTLASDGVTGMQDGLLYYVKSAMVDLAGNIAYFQPDSNDEACSPNYPLAAKSPASINPVQCHTVTPSLVEGVLENQLNCFIATASYGSIMAPQVGVFRKFRDTYLLPFAWGRKFVGFYYAQSPRLARVIARSESLRFISRAALAPFLAYAWLSLKLGALNAAFLLAGLFALPLAGFQIVAASKRWRRNKEWKRP